MSQDELAISTLTLALSLPRRAREKILREDVPFLLAPLCGERIEVRGLFCSGGL
jgi:hypothetical protein